MRTPQSHIASHALALGALLVTVALAASACASGGSHRAVADLSGGSGSAAQPSNFTPAQLDQRMVDFTRCLRSRGVDEPDPFHRPGHSGLSISMPSPGPNTSAGLAACNHFITPIAQMKEAGARRELAQWLPQLTRYAQCMRAHNIPMLDPNAQGSLNLGSVPGITNDFGRYSAQFRDADSACRGLLPSAVHDDGTGP